MRSRAGHERGVRFGVFEFDAQNFLLYKRGADVGLEAQPAQLLGLLLGRPGQVLSRQEIQQVFWPKASPDDDCVKDRINHAIRRIREVLHDRQDDPQFIETIPKRGYRFIGQIQGVSANEPFHAERAGTDSETPISTLSRAPVAGLPSAAPHTKRTVTVLSVAAAVSLFFVTFVLATRTGTPVITYVSPIRARPDQTIIIRGHSFGKFAPYHDTDSPYLAIRNNTVHWAAGRIMVRNFDAVMLTVIRWTDSEIVVTGFTGKYGHGAWKLNSGDAIEVAVWNPQTGAGPAKYHLRVTGLQASR